MFSSTRVSLCMIVGNEENNLQACLEPVVPFVHEIVVVDTGSTDRTRDLAAGLGARVFDFRWREDFAAARNESLHHATGDWIFWLDADDRLNTTNLDRLRELFMTLGDEPRAFWMDTISQSTAINNSAMVTPHCRLFRRHPFIRWERRVHEQILPSIERVGHEVAASGIQIQHVGYQDAALYQRKAHRNLRILRMEHATDPEDPFTLFNLGLAHLEIGQVAEALSNLIASLKQVKAPAEWVRRLYAVLCETFFKTGRHHEAFALTIEGLARFPDDPMLTTRHACRLFDAGHFGEAEQSLVRFLHNSSSTNRWAGDQSILDGRAARCLLGAIYQAQGRYVEAERVFQELLAEHPAHLQGWLGLSYVYLAQARFGDIEFVARQMEKCSHGTAHACVLRAQSHLHRDEFEPARELLEQVIAESPQMVWPRIVLGDWLMKSGADSSTCIAAQREILRLDQGNVAAQQHLTRMLSDQRNQMNAVPLWGSFSV